MPCEISVSEALEKANIQIIYSIDETEAIEVESLGKLVEFLKTNMCRKSISDNATRKIERIIIVSPRNFFPELKSGFTLIDTPGFSETKEMKEVNLAILKK